VTTAKRLLQKDIVPRDRVIACCVSSTFSTTVAVDEMGNHLANALTWADSRGAPYVREVMKGFPSVDGYGLFKLLRWIPKTAGCPLLSGKDDVAHVLLWKHEHPEVYEKARMFLPSKDYLNLRLTGEFATSDVWCQIMTDVLNREIGQVKDPQQDNARGAAFIAAVGMGYISFDDVPDLVPLEKSFSPNPANRKIYDELFGEFLNIQKLSKSICQRLNRNGSQ